MNWSTENDGASFALKSFFLLGASVLFVRFLLWSDTFHSGLLYIAWPFVLSLAVYYFTPHTDGASWKKQLWNNFRYSLILVLASSLILMEGYVCVVMALPIFFVGFLIAFIWRYLSHRFGKGSLNAHIIPIIVAIISIEGVTEFTTFDRYNEVSHTQVVRASVEDIKKRLENPTPPKAKRHWMLSIFPMPKKIGTTRLEQGEVRTYEFEYHRWFATNTHRGNIQVSFAKVSDNRFETTINDTSYIAGYMKLHGTKLQLDPINENETRVTLKVAFDRAIDPVWYFEPLQRFVVKKGAAYFITNIMGTGI